MTDFLLCWIVVLLNMVLVKSSDTVPDAQKIPLFAGVVVVSGAIAYALYLALSVLLKG